MVDAVAGGIVKASFPVTNTTAGSLSFYALLLLIHEGVNGYQEVGAVGVSERKTLAASASLTMDVASTVIPPDSAYYDPSPGVTPKLDVWVYLVTKVIVDEYGVPKWPFYEEADFLGAAVATASVKVTE